MRCLLIALLPLTIWPQPSSSRPADGAGAAMGSITGSVKNALTGEAVRKATIDFNRQDGPALTPGAPTSYKATTDNSGNFAIAGVAPGTYRATASQTGYLKMEYNSRRPGGIGTALDVRLTEKTTAVNFRLTPQSLISGRITDPDWDPLENIEVRLLREEVVSGMRRLEAANFGRTNDLGEYRIASVTPGKYYICAIPRPGDATMRAKYTGREDFATTYYPGVTDAERADPITLAPGEQKDGANLILNRTHTFHLRGAASDHSLAEPNPAVAVFNWLSLDLTPRSGANRDNLPWQDMKPDPVGKFDIAGVPPGSYYLVVRARPGPGNIRSSAMPIEVIDRDVDDVEISVAPGITVVGRVRYDGGPPEPPPSMMARVMTHPSSPFVASQRANVASDGSFRLDGVSRGLYDFMLDVPRGMYLKSVRSGDTDVLADGLDLTHSVRPLDVVLGLHPALIKGTVTNGPSSVPVAAAIVLALAHETAKRRYYYWSTYTDQHGNFSFEYLGPGEYDVYAWEDFDLLQLTNQGSMKRYEDKGETVTAQEGSTVTVKVRLIPAK